MNHKFQIMSKSVLIPHKCQPLWCWSKSCLLLLQRTALFALPSSWSFIKMFLSESRVLLLHPFYIALSFFRWAFLGELVCQFKQFLHPAGTHRLLFLHKKKGEKECILAHRSCLADVKSWNKWRFVRAQDWRISTAPVHPAAPIYQCNIVASQQRNCTNLLMHQFTNDAYSTYTHPSSNTPMHHFALQQCTVSRVQWNECHVI